MATVKINVEYIAQNPNSAISGVTYPASNNTSTNSVLNGNANRKPFVFGASKFGEGQKFISSYNGFASRECSDNNGVFLNPVSLTISGAAIENLKIKFSESLGQYATELIIDGKTYINESLVFVTSGLSGDIHTVQIAKWSEPKFNARIDSIGMGYTAEYTNRQIIALLSGNYSTADEEAPSYGLISQYGDMQIKDINNQLKNLAGQQLLNSNSQIRIYFNGEQQGNLMSDEWRYNINEASVDFKDDMLGWQNMDFKGKTLVFNTNLFSVIKEIETIYNIKFILREGVQSQATNTVLAYLYIEACTLWEAMDKICKAGQFRLWQDKDGRINIGLRN